MNYLESCVTHINRKEGGGSVHRCYLLFVFDTKDLANDFKEIALDMGWKIDDKVSHNGVLCIGVYIERESVLSVKHNDVLSSYIDDLVIEFEKFVITYN